MTYDFHLTLVLDGEDEKSAKAQAAQILIAVGVLHRENMIELVRLGMALDGPNGPIELTPPEFPNDDGRSTCTS